MKSWAVSARSFGLYVAWNQMGLLHLFEMIMLFQRHAVWLPHFHCTEQESEIHPHGSITQTWQLYSLPGPFWALSLSLPFSGNNQQNLGIMCCVAGEMCFHLSWGSGYSRQLQALDFLRQLSPLLKAKKQASKGGNVARKLGGPMFSFFAWFIFPKKKKKTATRQNNPYGKTVWI